MDCPNHPPHEHEDDAPRLAIRRATDRCFHAVEEVVRGPGGEVEGYIVEGFMIPADEVAQVRGMDTPNEPRP